MKTTFFNVQHGDAIFINFGDRGLVRDFGTLSPNSQNYVRQLASFLKRIKKRYSDFPLEAMLSHPHQDHYSGFEYLLTSLKCQKFFDISYIPWLDFSTLNSLHAVYLQFGLLHLYMFPQSYVANQNTKDWIKIAPLMADLSRCLLGVGEGTNLPHKHFVEQILWPPQGPYALPICCDVFLPDYIDFVVNELLSDKQKELYQRTVDKVLGILSSIHLDGKENRESNTFMKISEVLENIIPFDLEFVKYPFVQRISHSIQLKMQNDIDNHSIVFKIDEEALYFSDLHSGPIGKIAMKHLVNQKFKLMKSAHHGSRFGAKMPKSNCTASKIVHSCGASPYNYDGPDVRYCQLLTQQTPPNYANDIICTDWDHASLKWKSPNHGYNIVSPKKRITL